MMPRPAQYLLRFDDFCPTFSLPKWERFEALLDEFGVHPIIAIVPDNRDSELTVSNPDPAFWERMRALQASGATVALHGYQHSCDSRGRSLIPLHHRTEFAGVPERDQRHWIQEGIQILRRHDLTPKLFVAPRHGFDRATLRVLQAEGIRYISDGFARVPFVRGGVIWIPQQLWAPVEEHSGLWTICIHSNYAADWLVKRLHAFLRMNSAQFTTFDRVVAEFPAKPLSPGERLHEWSAMTRTRLSRAKGRFLRKRSRSRG